MPAPLFTPEVRSYIAKQYLAADIPPRELAAALKQDFGLTVTSAQLRQHISRIGLAARKRELEAKAAAIVAPAGAALTIQKSADTVQHLDRWASQAIIAADKAFEQAAASGKARDLAAAVAAAASAVRLFHKCAGIEPTAKPAQAQFNYNFANVVVPEAGAVPEPVDATAVEGRVETPAR